MKPYKISKHIVIESYISMAIIVLISIALGAALSVTTLSAGSVHVLLMLSLGLLILILMVLFVANLFYSVLSSQKRPHLVMLILIPITVITAFSLSRRWEHYGHRRWFLEKALPEYQEAVNKILKDPSMLKDQERLQVLVDRPIGCSYIHSEIKSDGSVAIFFSGADHWREGHAYFSGGQTNYDAYHYLTNNWYEY